MIVGLTWLAARRAAPLPVMLMVLIAASLPLLATAPEGVTSLPELVNARDGGTQKTAWLAALLLATTWSCAAGVRMAGRWFNGEAAWRAPSTPSRLALASLGVAGTAAGSAALALVAGGLLAAVHPRASAGGASDEPLRELLATTGPEGSVTLLKGESFEHWTPGFRGAGRWSRIRVTPTVGGDAPTSRIRLEAWARSGEERELLNLVETTVARRRWLTIHDPGGSRMEELRLTNVGDGAVAVLGPRPVEIWRPSPALAGGQLRAAAHGALWLAAVGALGAAAGAWMSPWIAGMLTAALSLFVALGSGAPLLGPLGAGIADSLTTLDEGMAPPAPSSIQWLCCAAICGLSALAVLPTLTRWTHEGRR